MGFSHIKFINFRNLKDAEINIDAPVVFLIGENGQGKTNFIEGLYYLCFGSSFRTRINERIIKKDMEFSFIKGAYRSTDEVNREVSVRILKNKKKEIKVDNKIISDRKEIVQNIPCIVFSYDDMVFIKGSPEYKRWFINQTLSLFEPDFINLLRDYRKILKNRNICLKERKTDLIPLYNEKIASIGFKIQEKRRQLLEEYNKTFSAYYGLLCGNTNSVRLVYKPSWHEADSEEAVLSLLKKKMKIDMDAGLTTTGPHRDTIAFIEGKNNFVYQASTGQMRLLSIVLKIAQARYFYEKTNKKPVLLIDDVLLELDRVKRIMFYRCLTDIDQVFFTFLPDESFIESEKGEIIKYYLQNGELFEWTKQEKS